MSSKREKAAPMPVVESMPQGSTRVAIAAMVASLGFLCFEVLCAAYASGQMWGVHSLRFVGDSAPLLVVLAVSTVCALAMHRHVISLVAWMSRYPWQTAAVVTGISAVLFWNLRATTSFLGDGNILLLSLPRMTFRTSDVFDHHLHALFYKTFIAPQRGELILSYSILSGLAGVVFVTGTMLFCQTICRTFGQKVFCFLFVTTCGYMEVFFGYVESYSLFYSVFPWYAALSIRAIKGKSPIPALIACSIAVAFSQTAALVGLSMLLAMWMSIARAKNKVAATILYCSIPLGVGTVVVMYLLTAGFSFEQYRAMLAETGMSSGKVFLPLFSGSYAALSPRHLLDCLNLHLLSSPIAFIALVFAIRPRLLLKDRIAQFLFLMFFFELAFFFMMDPRIDLVRDWDLQSGPIVLYTLFVVYVLIHEGVLAWRPRAQITIVGVSAFHALAWIALNHDAEASAHRFAVLSESRQAHTLPNVTGHNFEQLGAFYSERKNFKVAAECLEKGVAALPHPRRYNSLAMVYVQMGDYTRAGEAFGRAADLDSNQVESRLNQAISLHRAQRFDEAASALARVIRRGYVKDDILGVLGDCYTRTGRTDDALAAYTQAVQLNPGNRDALNALWQIYRAKKQYAAALDCYQRAIAKGAPNDPTVMEELTAAARRR